MLSLQTWRFQNVLWKVEQNVLFPTACNLYEREFHIQIKIQLKQVYGKLKLPICHKTIYVRIKYRLKILLCEFSPDSQSSSLSRKWDTLVRFPFSPLTVNIASTTEMQLRHSVTVRAARGCSCCNGGSGVTNETTIASTKLEYGAKGDNLSGTSSLLQ